MMDLGLNLRKYDVKASVYSTAFHCHQLRCTVRQTQC